MTVQTVKGFSFASAASGMRYKGRDDLALICCDKPAMCVGLFTTSTAASPPVKLSRKRLAKSPYVKAVVVNAGIANAASGKEGDAAALKVCTLAADALGCKVTEVLSSSTGIIGPPLPTEPIEAKLPELIDGLAPERMEDVARAMMTTDTVHKAASARCKIMGKTVTIAGIAKGSGMIAPNMATMLAYIVTDAALTLPFARKIFRETVDAGFNALTIDGDMSTSDTALMLASGAAGHTALKSKDADAVRFSAALQKVVTELTRQLARDGEGAKKLVLVKVSGARGDGEAKKVAKAIAESPLVKTAIAGEDANWGRIVMAIGKSGVSFNMERVDLHYNRTQLVKGGKHQGEAAEAAAARELKTDEVSLKVNLHQGSGAYTCYTCDLTHEYISINADYRS